MNKLSFSLLLTIFISMNLMSQNLSQHQWKHRLVLIITTDVSSEIFKNQLKEFSGKTKAFDDRKLLIYLVSKSSYKIENKRNSSWMESPELFTRYNSEKTHFKVVLIGLDGSIKLQQTNMLSSEDLFSTIDAMPMRRSEIRNRN